MKENVVLLLVAMLVVIPLLGPLTGYPRSGWCISGRALRNGLFESIAVLLLAVLLARVQIQGGLSGFFYLLRTGVNAPLAAFLLWAALGALRAPDRAFAVADLLRLGTGVLVYYAVALHVESRAQLCLLLDCLLGLVLLVTGYGLLFHGIESVQGLGIWSIFPSRHHLSAILAVLFPLLGVMALRVREMGRRLASITAAVWCAIGLVICLERSAWIAVAVGVALGLLLWLGVARSVALRGSWRPAMAVVLPSLLVTFVFFYASGVNAVVVPRAREISTAVQGHDTSFSWRVRKWRGAAAMARQRPIWGWGPGQFVLQQSRFTHLGLSRGDVRRFGASFDEMAYNEYLQTAAELGFPGLLLYLLVLASFFSKAGRALRRLPVGLRQTILIGCMGGVAAQMVDALANGSWRFMECSIFLWLVLGLGVSASRMAYQKGEERNYHDSVV